jgi:hypothetical protein
VCFVRAGHLAERADSRELRLEADLLAFFNVMAAFLSILMPGSRVDGDAAALMFHLPLIQTGSIEVMREFRGGLASGYWPHPLLLLALALPLWSAVFSVRLFLRLRKIAERGEQSNSR